MIKYFELKLEEGSISSYWECEDVDLIDYDQLNQWADLEDQNTCWLCISDVEPEDGEAWEGLQTDEGLHFVDDLGENSLFIDFCTGRIEISGHVWVWIELSIKTPEELEAERLALDKKIEEAQDFLSEQGYTSYLPD